MARYSAATGEKVSIWCAPRRRNRGTRTCCAWLIGLVDTGPRCGHLRLVLIALDRIRGDDQRSVVELPSIELRNKHISRRSLLPENKQRSPSARSSQPAPSQSGPQLIWGSIFRRNRWRRPFRGPASVTRPEMKADDALTFRRTCKAGDVNYTRPRLEGAE